MLVDRRSPTDTPGEQTNRVCEKILLQVEKSTFRRETKSTRIAEGTRFKTETPGPC